jgi:hypothetical protein
MLLLLLSGHQCLEQFLCRLYNVQEHAKTDIWPCTEQIVPNVSHQHQFIWRILASFASPKPVAPCLCTWHKDNGAGLSSSCCCCGSDFAATHTGTRVPLHFAALTPH